MRCIVLTGGIACGKSAAEKMFSELGVPVIDADVIAKDLTVKTSPYCQQIIDHFGGAFCLPDHSLDRKALAHHIFSNPHEKKWLEALLHPPILLLIEKHISMLPRDTPYCIITLPLLADMVEHPAWIDAVIVMVCPPALQLQRLLKRSTHDTVSTAQNKIRAQANTNTRLKLADYTLHNDGTLADLKAQVYHLHEQLIRTASNSI
jgi:dephospho-CoA kinase